MHQTVLNFSLRFPAVICNKNNHFLAFGNVNLNSLPGSAVGEMRRKCFSILFWLGQPDTERLSD